MVDNNSQDYPYRLDEQHGEGYSPDIADTKKFEGRNKEL